MKKYLFLASLLLVILACTLPIPTAAPAKPTAVPPGITPNTTGPTQPVVSAGTLRLQILSPLDGAVVSTSQVEIVGTAPAGAVVSVNDDILIVGSDGQFKSTVTLEEGPNVIEIIANDASGNQVYLLLSVFYEL
jgi:hypothetical protein